MDMTWPESTGSRLKPMAIRTNSTIGSGDLREATSR
jgi:hypothetical protein